jgi:hypothetical protein
MQGLTGDPAEHRVDAARKGDGDTIEQMLWPDHVVQGTKARVRRSPPSSGDADTPQGCEIEEGIQARLDKLGIGEKAFIIQKARARACAPGRRTCADRAPRRARTRSSTATPRSR